jgi:pilus assembly protein CpaD
MKATRILSLILVCSFVAGLGGCFKPPRGMPDASVIEFDGRTALSPDCASLARPSELTDAGLHRPDMQWGCATYTNLAAQVAHPRDLVAPHKLDPADAATGASAVRRYERGDAAAIDKTSIRDVK